MLIMAALLSVPAMQSTMAEELPATLPSHTLSMTPAVSSSRELASPTLGVLNSMKKAMRQVNTGMEALHVSVDRVRSPPRLCSAAQEC